MRKRPHGFDAVLARLGDRLREQRVARGMSQEQASELTGLDVRYLQRIESGRVNPTLRTLVLFTQAYGSRLTELLADLEDQGHG